MTSNRERFGLTHDKYVDMANALLNVVYISSSEENVRSSIDTIQRELYTNAEYRGNNASKLISAFDGIVAKFIIQGFELADAQDVDWDYDWAWIEDLYDMARTEVLRYDDINDPSTIVQTPIISDCASAQEVISTPHQESPHPQDE
jgi:hypothetical protein